MDLSNRLANLAKRTLPVSRDFDEIIRSIGECKSKVRPMELFGWQCPAAMRQAAQRASAA